MRFGCFACTKWNDFLFGFVFIFLHGTSNAIDTDMTRVQTHVRGHCMGSCIWHPCGDARVRAQLNKLQFTLMAINKSYIYMLISLHLLFADCAPMR